MAKYYFLYQIKKRLVRLRFLLYFITGRYSRLFEYCRRLSLFSKRLNKEVFAGFYIENFVLKTAENILDKHSVNYRSLPANNTKARPKVALLATTIVDSGGHTECILRFVETFEKEFELALFLNNSYGDSRQTAPKKYSYLNERISVYSTHFSNYEKSLIDLFGAINKYDPDIVFVYAHTLDAISVAIMGILKRYGKARIVFYNHGDHLLSLGKCFTHLIIEARRVGQYITQQLGGLKNTCIIPFQVNGPSRGSILTDSQIVLEREKLNIRPDEVISLSGFSAHKVFCDENLEYFRLLKRLFQTEPNFRHVFISNLTISEKAKIKVFFSDQPEFLDRIIFLDFVPDFEKYVQICDFFIDSFPIGSALTHVDIIKYRKPTVIKINQVNQIYSFEEYLYDDYELACKTMDEIYENIIKLIRNRQERIRIGQKVYEFYLERYDKEKVAQQYREIIENREHLHIFYHPLDDDITFNIGPDS